MPDNSPSIANPKVYYWDQHPSVWFAVYGGRHSLRLACARQSVFLEDRRLAGTVLEEIPRSCDHAAAGYSGHNFTPEGMFCFRQAACSGEGITSSEKALHTALAKAGAWSVTDGSGSIPRCAGVLAVAKGLSRQECEDTLVHECMHGLFYSDSVLREAVWNQWQTVLSEPQRTLWIAFLDKLGYNAARDETLAVNELLAYMCTEKQLLNENNESIQELCKIRKTFVAAIQNKVPVPPCVGQAGCIWQWQNVTTATVKVKARCSKQK